MNWHHMKNFIVTILLTFFFYIASAHACNATEGFAVKGFHLDLRIQVMTMKALNEFAHSLKQKGFNTLIIEWESTFPFEKHPLVSGKYAYKKSEVEAFLKYCNSIGLDVIPLQQCFGHVEYILQHQRYKKLREDQKDYSQVCPMEVNGDSLLFSDLFSELTQMHSSQYLHIGGDETYLLGRDEKCKSKIEKESIAKLYADYITTMCNIVIKLGKRPVLWADIALKYPDAIKLLPKETIFVDWNYGWNFDRFGDHKRLVESGYEIWGAPAIRSWPDNYYLTDWSKHFNNIKDFLPASEKLGYKGIILTSWSTSGLYNPVFESEFNLMTLSPIRHVYPLSGFNMLIDEFSQICKNPQTTFDETDFIVDYGKNHFGFSPSNSKLFWKSLNMTPFDVRQGVVASPFLMTIKQLLDSGAVALTNLNKLRPTKNQAEFEHFRLMADIREFHLQYEWIESRVNDSEFHPSASQYILTELSQLIERSKLIDQQFIFINKDFLIGAELETENAVRNSRVQNLYERLKLKTKN
jgi:hexosaminidase